MSKEKNHYLNITFIALSAISMAIGLLGGFLCAYKNAVENYTKYTGILIETKNYQQVLRKEVKANAESKIDKTRAWEEINKINARIEYLERNCRMRSRNE
jgi:hypothetical protein